MHLKDEQAIVERQSLADRIICALMNNDNMVTSHSIFMYMYTVANRDLN